MRLTPRESSLTIFHTQFTCRELGMSGSESLSNLLWLCVRVCVRLCACVCVCVFILSLMSERLPEQLKRQWDIYLQGWTLHVTGYILTGLCKCSSLRTPRTDEEGYAWCRGLWAHHKHCLRSTLNNSFTRLELRPRLHLDVDSGFFGVLVPHQLGLFTKWAELSWQSPLPQLVFCRQQNVLYWFQMM